MRVDVISLFPEYFDSPLQVSILERAQSKGIVSIHRVDLRSYGIGSYQQVDDLPFGGGSGMVLKPEPLYAALDDVMDEGAHVVLMAPQGKVLTHALAMELSKKQHLIVICGHYEGVDQRVIDRYVDEEISIGDFVVSNGCIGALVLLEAVMRLAPGVLGNPDSLVRESFVSHTLEGPQYTRPACFQGRSVPSVLLEGHHRKIEQWREKEAVSQTQLKRWDMHTEYLQEECRLCISLPVQDLDESYACYKKLFDRVEQREFKIHIFVGETIIQLYLGKTMPVLDPMILTLEPHAFTALVHRIQNKNIVKEWTLLREDLVLIQDDNGYWWGFSKRRQDVKTSITTQ